MVFGKNFQEKKHIKMRTVWSVGSPGYRHTVDLPMCQWGFQSPPYYTKDFSRSNLNYTISLVEVQIRSDMSKPYYSYLSCTLN